MTLIELIPLAISRHSEPDRVSATIILGCGVLLSSMLFAGWSSGAAAETQAHSTKAPARAEADGGNPKFYEVFGKRYHVRASSDGYRESGVASWYGRPFHGRPTSSGEMYDMNEMTAAHTTLPLPTWVEVTNLSNGKRIVVKVNDRGPFVADRVIDLSYAAASALDIVRSGTARVEIRSVAKPPVAPPPAPLEPEPEPVSPAPPPAAQALALAQPERLFAEAGKFRTRTDAVSVVDGLRAQGLVNAFVVTEDGRRKSVHRVRVGPLLDESEVERMSDRLRELGAKRSRSVVMN
jgi:peptidoglycan lytic transglycosylase